MASNRIRTLDVRLKEARQTAWKQQGLLTAEDLRAHGLLNRKAYQRLTERELLVPVYRGVWRLRDARATERLQWRAALLWAGDGVLCSYTALKAHGLLATDASGDNTAFKLQGLDGAAASQVHISRPRSRSDAPGGIRLHRQRELAPAAMSIVGGFRVTTVERALLDLSTELPEEALQWALEAAWHRRKLDPENFLGALNEARRKGTAGVGVLKKLLSGAIRRRRPLESPLEVRTWRSMEKAGLPPPQVQVTLRDAFGALRPDFLYEGEQLIVEALGFEKHGTREAFENDVLRVLRLAAMGFSVLPVSWRILEEREADVMAWIADSLRHRRAQLGSLVCDAFSALTFPDPVTQGAQYRIPGPRAYALAPERPRRAG